MMSVSFGSASPWHIAAASLSDRAWACAWSSCPDTLSFCTLKFTARILRDRKPDFWFLHRGHYTLLVPTRFFEFSKPTLHPVLSLRKQASRISVCFVEVSGLLLNLGTLRARPWLSPLFFFHGQCPRRLVKLEFRSGDVVLIIRQCLIAVE